MIHFNSGNPTESRYTVLMIIFSTNMGRIGTTYILWYVNVISCGLFRAFWVG